MSDETEQRLQQLAHDLAVSCNADEDETRLLLERALDSALTPIPPLLAVSRVRRQPWWARLLGTVRPRWLVLRQQRQILAAMDRLDPRSSQ